MGISGLQSNTCFLGPTRVHNPNGTSIGSAVFAGFTIVTDRLTDRQPMLWHFDQFSRFCTAHGREFLHFYNRPLLFPSKLPLRMGISGLPSNTCFLGPTRVHNRNGVSIGSAVVFAGFTIVTDQPTDRQTMLFRL